MKKSNFRLSIEKEIGSPADFCYLNKRKNHYLLQLRYPRSLDLPDEKINKIRQWPHVKKVIKNDNGYAGCQCCSAKVCWVLVHLDCKPSEFTFENKNADIKKDSAKWQNLPNGISIRWTTCQCGCVMNEIHNAPKEILEKLSLFMDQVEFNGVWVDEIEDLIISLVGKKIWRKLGTDNLYIENGIIYSI